MENAKSIFEEIIKYFNGALSKERNQIFFELETKVDETTGVIEKNVILFRGKERVVTFAGNDHIDSPKSTPKKIEASLENRVFTRAIKDIFLEGIDSFQSKPF